MVVSFRSAAPSEPSFGRVAQAPDSHSRSSPGLNLQSASHNELIYTDTSTPAEDAPAACSLRMDASGTLSIHLKPIKDQVIVITGASSGIGLATAERADHKHPVADHKRFSLPKSEP